MQKQLIMHGSNKNEHQDIIRIIVSSDQSFDDAVKSEIEELKKGGKHDDLEFKTYEVFQFQGTICDSGQSCAVQFYQVVLDVDDVHKDHQLNLI